MRVFGPVPSRRLGYSLGIDPITFKACTLDCLYCQLGPTTQETLERKEYVPTGKILKELEERLKEGGRIDWITLSGSGEPTLHSRIGEIIRAIKEITDIPVAVLTNGTLLHDSSLREELSAADLVIPSLDAGCEETFLRVNRPHPDLSFEKVIKGMEEFSRDFKGRIWLELMLMRGINEGPDELALMASIILKIKPDKVHLNTVTRPPSSEKALPLTLEELKNARLLLEGLLPGIPVEVVRKFREEKRETVKKDVEESILGHLMRRPATLEDLSSALGLHKSEVNRYLKHLVRSGNIVRRLLEGKDYFLRKRAGYKDSTQNARF